MSELLPPLPTALRNFIQHGLSILIGTRGPDLMPETVRGVGVELWPDARGLKLFVPVANGARTLANLRDNQRIAITLSRPLTHETVQLKGTVTHMRDADASERAFTDAYVVAVSGVLAYCGLPPHVTRRMTSWPATVLDVVIEDVFLQTPGPGAGERLTTPAKSSS